MGGRASLGGRSLAKAIASTKEVYSFPILEPDEIVEVLREMGAAVTEEDLNKPKCDSFRQWCELFVIEILEINKDELYDANFEFAEALGGSEELHEASVPVVHFIRCMFVHTLPGNGAYSQISRDSIDYITPPPFSPTPSLQEQSLGSCQV